MEHYVTLFDSLFLPQGIALHMSMERHLSDYKLWVLCVDDITYDVLHKLELPHVCLMRLSEVETDELIEAKRLRTKGEFCWTLTPFAPRFVLEADETVSRVTYVDADLWFRRNPFQIFGELDESGKSVLITEHAYAPQYDQSFSSGLYCVQFVTFKRNGSEAVRKWWEDRCIEWCYARFEDGKFGDQKYLDDWPERFGESVHVLENKALALAPWNASRFPFGLSVFFHFHELRIVSRNVLRIGNYQLPGPVIEHVYKPYAVDLKAAYDLVLNAGFSPKPQAGPLRLVERWDAVLKNIVRTIRAKIPTGSIEW